MQMSPEARKMMPQMAIHPRIAPTGPKHGMQNRKQPKIDRVNEAHASHGSIGMVVLFCT